MSEPLAGLEVPAPERPRVLAVAGVDPCGGAGLVADVRAIEWAGGFALGVPTCTTAQDRHGFRSASVVELAGFSEMLEAVASDGPIDAVKSGLFVDVRHLELFAEWLGTLAPRPPWVIDPVLSITAGGGEGVVDACASAYRTLCGLGPVLTPNRPELERLVDGDPDELLRRGAAAVFVKGGHGEGREVVDVLHRPGSDPVGMVWPRQVRVGEMHGTGCFLASVLATRLAAGDEVLAAARTAGRAVHDWIDRTPDAVLPTPLAGRRAGAPDQ